MEQHPVERAVRDFIYSRLIIANHELKTAALKVDVDPEDFRVAFINSRVTVSFWED